jgi:hypothetical protein
MELPKGRPTVESGVVGDERWSPQRLLPRHHKMIDLAVEGLGRKEIAEKVGATPESVGLVLKSPMAQDEMARRRERRQRKQDASSVDAMQRARETLEKGSLDAAKTLVGLLENRDAAIAQRSAVAILDRAFGKDDRGQASVVINADTVQLLQAAISESRD